MTNVTSSCKEVLLVLWKQWEHTILSHLEIMTLFVLRKLILQTRKRSHPVGLDVWFFGWTLRLLPYFIYANGDDPGETARVRRLAWAFAGRLCDKYHNLMSWLNIYLPNSVLMTLSELYTATLFTSHSKSFSRIVDYILNKNKNFTLFGESLCRIGGI